MKWEANEKQTLVSPPKQIHATTTTTTTNRGYSVLQVSAVYFGYLMSLLKWSIRNSYNSSHKLLRPI